MKGVRKTSSKKNGKLKRVEESLHQVEAFDAKALSDLRLKDFCKEYLKTAKNTLAPTTYSYYVRIINSIIVPTLGHMRLIEIRPIHVQQFIQILQTPAARTIGDGVLSPGSIRRYFTVLRSVMAKAYKLELIDRNPTDTAKLDLPHIEEDEVAVFNKEETIHLLECLKKEPLMYRVLIHMAIVTGARRGELVALKWEHINHEKKSVKIVQSNYQIKGEAIKSKTPKTRRSTREIALPDYLMPMLDELRSLQLAQKREMGKEWHDEGWIFTQKNGRPMYPSTPTLWFSRFQARYNIPHRKFHALRHTSGTLLLLYGTDIKTVASRLGHTQLSTTNRYLHSLSAADIAAAASFESILIDDEKDKLQ